MVKLTEIYSLPSGYDATLEKNRDLFSLREIIVNPDYVVFLKDCDMLNKKSESGALVEGLSQDVVFTQLIISTTSITPRTINVVGSLQQTLEKF
tara:strand:+ start:338 stop:619 length:282 start_codon:yes stop_codon:yes gene_type:complete